MFKFSKKFFVFSVLAYLSTLCPSGVLTKQCTKNNHPYLVSITDEESGKARFFGFGFCLGALITAWFAATDSTCLCRYRRYCRNREYYPPKYRPTICGGYYQCRRLRRAVLDSDYDQEGARAGTNPTHSLAIIQVDKEFVKGLELNTIQLPPANFYKNNKKAEIVGAVLKKNNEIGDVMCQSATLSTWSSCQNEWNFKKNDGLLCTEYENLKNKTADNCQHNLGVGRPVVIDNYLVGIEGGCHPSKSRSGMTNTYVTNLGPHLQFVKSAIASPEGKSDKKGSGATSFLHEGCVYWRKISMVVMTIYGFARFSL